MRIMYDSVSPSLIPAHAEMVMGYIDGKYTWSEEDWARFPGAVKVGISVEPAREHGDVLDVERGDATPDDASWWITARRVAGSRWHAIYCNRVTVPAVLDATAHLRIRFGLVVADWTGQPHELPGAVAVQYASTPEYDLTAVYDASWHRK